MNIDPCSPYGWQDQRSVLGHDSGPTPSVPITYSEAVQKQSQAVTQGLVQPVRGKVASATSNQLKTSFNLN